MTESPSSHVASVAGLIAANIMSSVSLILLNKTVMNVYGFQFVLFLSACHFLATALFTRTAAHFHMFPPKRSAMPFGTVVLMAVSGCASVAFMNLNLKKNSVGFYQMTKLLCIPYMVVYNRFARNSRVSIELLASLLLILLGVGIATVTDVDVNAEGLAYGVLAIVTTSQFQLLQGYKQTEFGVNAMQITDIVMPVQLLICSFISMFFETGLVFGSADSAVLEATDFSWSLIRAILLTCVMAIAVNILTYALIGKTSAVTFQVIGHMKTVLTLMGGYYLFAHNANSQRWGSNLFGIVVALIGMIIYGDIKTNASSGKTLLQKYGDMTFWSREF